MAIHAHAMPVVDSQEQDIDRARHVEGPDMNPFRIDLRLHQVEVVTVRGLRQFHPLRKTGAPGRGLLRHGNPVGDRINVRF
jgi:hypothetical protein